MEPRKFRVAVFASGSGTNAEQIFNYFKNHAQVEIVLLLSNNSNAFVLERARKAGVPTKVFSRDQFTQSNEILSLLKENKVTHLVLAGFMWLIPSNLLSSFPDRIINIHPALLPKYGGKGMYGHHVHEAVKKADERETGITIHLVNDRYDEGRILFQARTALEPTDDPNRIAEKVHALEYAHYPREIEKWILGNS